MKISELQIGDWVEAIGLPHRITGIRKVDGVYVADIESEYTHDGCQDVEYLNPIRINPEILEKNGFRYERVRIPHRWVYEGYCTEIRIEERTDINYGVNVLFLTLLYHNAYSAFWPTQYIHQLQNAMRLLGIENEIKL